MNHLADRVNSGVGSATGVGGRDGSGQLTEGLLERFLNRTLIGLALPAGEIGPVVAHQELDVSHQAEKTKAVPAPRPNHRPSIEARGISGEMEKGNAKETRPDSDEEVVNQRWMVVDLLFVHPKR